MRLLHVFTAPQTLALVGAQVDYLSARGFEIRAISSPGDRLDEFGSEHGISVTAVAMRRAISPVADVGALIRLVRAIRSFRPHIVHSHTPKAGLLGTLAATLARTPLRIYQIRGLLSTASGGARGALYDSMERVSCRLAHHVIYQSSSLSKEALSHRLCSPERSSVLGSGGNGIDVTGRFDPKRHPPATKSGIRSQLGIDDQDLVIGFVGRLVRDKGISDLVTAWQTLRREFPRAHLLLVGPPEERDALTLSVNEVLDSDPRVHRTGLVPDVAPYYAAMELLVLPSYREGLPNAPLEAAALQTPVVTTNVTGCVDAVVDGVTGTLVPPRDPVALAAAIRIYLESPELRGNHGLAGRRFVIEHFSEDSVCEAIHAFYERLWTERCGEPSHGAAI
ncbi:MAG: glycosyltransferase family 4 protein [Acidobacteriota bacterium]|nr:glycosyltransferase family 4 protein [Acidobacteriota bacterium]